jgi:hypothetical protein
VDSTRRYYPEDKHRQLHRREQPEILLVRFQYLTAASMKVTFFWDIAPCALVLVDQCFGGNYCHHQIALIMETVSTYETSVNFYDSTGRNIPESSHPQTSRCES